VSSTEKATPPTPRAKRSRIRLKNAFDVMALQAKAIRQLVNDEITTDKFRALTYGLDLLLKAVKAGDFEQRLSQIEQTLSQKEGY